MNSSFVSDRESLQIEAQYAGERLDRVLAAYFPQLSRSQLQAWIKNNQVFVNGHPLSKPKHKVLGGENLQLVIALRDQQQWQASDINLNIHYQDERIIVINKPAGLVVHPAPGHYSDTLVNGLLFHFPELRKLPRAGIVHRLDKDTTGLLVVARDLSAHNHLVTQLQARAFQREYYALVHGQVIAGDSIELPIGRHPQNRKKMAVVKQGKEAITHYRLLKKFADFTLLKVKLETGRTHQIRVHLSHINYPLVGDPLYRSAKQQPAGANQNLITALNNFKRQALHAKKLALLHPQNKQLISWECDLPEDFQQLLNVVADNQKNQ